MNTNGNINAIFESIKENPISDFSSNGELPLNENNLPPYLQKARAMIQDMPKVNSGTVGLVSTPESGVVQGEFNPKPATQSRRIVENENYGAYNPNALIDYGDELLPGEKPFPTNGFGQQPNVKPNFARPNVQPNTQARPNVVPAPHSNVVQQQTGGQIDYSILKLIIEDAISKEFEKRFPNEVDFLMIGKTIKFVDKNYNVYEGTLKKTGNLKQ